MEEEWDAEEDLIQMLEAEDDLDRLMEEQDGQNG